MATAANASEEQLVAARNQTLQAKFTSRRTKSLMLAVVFANVSVLLTISGSWTFVICALLVSLIGLSNYFAANGHLHRVQKEAGRRKRLVRDFSKLAPDHPTDQGSSDPKRSRMPRSPAEPQTTRLPRQPDEP